MLWTFIKVFATIIVSVPHVITFKNRVPMNSLISKTEKFSELDLFRLQYAGLLRTSRPLNLLKQFELLLRLANTMYSANGLKLMCRIQNGFHKQNMSRFDYV